MHARKYCASAGGACNDALMESATANEMQFTRGCHVAHVISGQVGTGDNRPAATTKQRVEAHACLPELLVDNIT